MTTREAGEKLQEAKNWILGKEKEDESYKKCNSRLDNIIEDFNNYKASPSVDENSIISSEAAALLNKSFDSQMCNYDSGAFLDWIRKIDGAFSKIYHQKTNKTQITIIVLTVIMFLFLVAAIILQAMDLLPTSENIVYWFSVSDLFSILVSLVSLICGRFSDAGGDSTSTYKDNSTNKNGKIIKLCKVFVVWATILSVVVVLLAVILELISLYK